MNNFGDILDKWISANGIQNKDEEEKDQQTSVQDKRRRLRNKKPDAEMDIHGKTRDEAWKEMEVFFNDAREKGFEKIMIIHGKGNHSTNGLASAPAAAPAAIPALKRVVMEFIERCPFAGESGKAKTSAGGEGATWVILKEAKEVS